MRQAKLRQSLACALVWAAEGAERGALSGSSRSCSPNTARSTDSSDKSGGGFGGSGFHGHAVMMGLAGGLLRAQIAGRFAGQLGMTKGGGVLTKREVVEEEE